MAKNRYELALTYLNYTRKINSDDGKSSDQLE